MADLHNSAPHAFVTGWPIKHSRSPLIHGYWLKQHALPGSYQAVAVAEEDFASFIASLKSGSRSFVGGNATLPHKEKAFQLCDTLDPVAEEMGAVNTMWLEEGRLHGTNTDGYGFAANLDEASPGWHRVDRAVVLGAGGASRAVIQALRDRGIGEIHVVNRTTARAQELAHRFGQAVHAHGPAALGEVMVGAGLFVNTTSLGMNENDTAFRFDSSSMKPNALITDIVYVPLETPILRQAREQGMRTADGLGMLLHQAVPGFEKWFGKRPAVDGALRQMIVNDIRAHR